MGSRHVLELKGCTPEPLMSYLKALGVLRLVSEQADPGVLGRWDRDVFVLDTTLSREELVEFFLLRYAPTPIVVPWSGGDFFAVNWQLSSPDAHKETPTASAVIEEILGVDTPRFAPYRKALEACRTVLVECGIDTKALMEKRKWDFIRTLRSRCDEPAVVEWIDAAAVGTVEKFASLLGSGGGSDGNTHFSDNFMQNLWDVLPDFDLRRTERLRKSSGPTITVSRELLRSVLFGSHTKHLIQKRTSALYDSGAVGGPNATQGMERKSLSNPWDVILGLEGTVCFAGAAVKRLGAGMNSDAAFPFQVAATVTQRDRMADREASGKEIWLPLWVRPTGWSEVKTLFREARAECGSRTAASGADVARAASTLGVDRGIQGFQRYAIVKGRVGGDNYNTAASLGRYEVRRRRGADLLAEADGWFVSFQRDARAKNAPPRLGSAVRDVDSAVLDFCRNGGEYFFQKVLVAFGRAERQLALVPRSSDRQTARPLQRLSADWIAAASDGSPEFEIALALAGIHGSPGPDPRAVPPPLRTNLEAVKQTHWGWAWDETAPSVVWGGGSLVSNMTAVLARRLLDGKHAGLAFHHCVRLPTIARFIAGDLDDQRIDELLWALVLADTAKASKPTFQESRGAAILPRAFGVLKPLFLPWPVQFESKARRWGYGATAGDLVRLEPRILPLLRAHRTREACEIAARRLFVSGIPPLEGAGSLGDSLDPDRLAAALLLPVCNHDLDELMRLVARDPEVDS